MSSQPEVTPPPYPDEEKQQEKGNEFQEGEQTYGDKGDPFGDETNAEVKYKSMSWWLVSLYVQILAFNFFPPFYCKES